MNLVRRPSQTITPVIFAIQNPVLKGSSLIDYINDTNQHQLSELQKNIYQSYIIEQRKLYQKAETSIVKHPKSFDTGALYTVLGATCFALAPSLVMTGVSMIPTVFGLFSVHAGISSSKNLDRIEALQEAEEWLKHN